MIEALSATNEMIEAWADDKEGAVALHLKQRLLPVEGNGGVVFPPTYAGIGYNIDKVWDDQEIALIDSVGSQANRMEPIFKEERYAKLIPQIDIIYMEQSKEKTVSILEAGHRLGDAIIRSTGDCDGFNLREAAHRAFNVFLESGDASEIAKLAPTSLVFGVWDSRDTQAKLPRIVQSVIRARDVKQLKRSAQFVPALDYAKLEVFSEDDKQKAEGKKESPLAQRGFVHVPAVEEPGGIIVRGEIERNLTINLIALRRLSGEKSTVLRRYILGLALIAATAPMDLFLRQGCLLVPDPEHPTAWSLVQRDGRRLPVNISSDVIETYAVRAAAAWGIGPSRKVPFKKEQARDDVKKSEKKGK